jgi:hypothetical protein
LDIQRLLAELKQERDRIQQAINALEGLGGGVKTKTARGRKGRRHMSADARARISAAMRKRWAQRKKSA